MANAAIAVLKTTRCTADRTFRNMRGIRSCGVKRRHCGPSERFAVQCEVITRGDGCTQVYNASHTHALRKRLSLVCGQLIVMRLRSSVRVVELVNVRKSLLTQTSTVS